MIPEFNEQGYLPPGVHQATLEEVIERFGVQSEVRQVQAESLQWLMPLCKKAGIARCLLNGSFVTDVLEPMDIDCVLLQGPKYKTKSSFARKLVVGLPFIELKVVGKEEFEFYASKVFASDRNMVRKGVVEVLLA